jgi:hypothetical protein
VPLIRRVQADRVRITVFGNHGGSCLAIAEMQIVGTPVGAPAMGFPPGAAFGGPFGGGPAGKPVLDPYTRSGAVDAYGKAGGPQGAFYVGQRVMLRDEDGQYYSGAVRHFDRYQYEIVWDGMYTSR